MEHYKGVLILPKCALRNTFPNINVLFQVTFTTLIRMNVFNQKIILLLLLSVVTGLLHVISRQHGKQITSREIRL